LKGQGGGSFTGCGFENSLFLVKRTVVKFFLLDGAGAGILVFIFALGLLFIISIIFIEAVVMWKMKLHPVYGRSLLHSLVVNLVSLAAGFVLVEIDSDLFHLDNMGGLGIMFGMTLLVEYLLLYLMNRTVPVKRLMTICFLMNLVSYAIALLIIIVR